MGPASFADRPGFALAAIVTLALGVSANTTAFTLLNALALRPMPVPDAGRVVRLRPLDATGHGQNLVSYPDYLDYREQSRSFDGLVAYTLATVTLGGGTDAAHASANPEEVLAYLTSANYFLAFGAAPALGRALLPHDEITGSPPVVVVSHLFWERRFGSNAAAIGETLTLNGHAFRIVGVGPRDFIGTEPIVPDVWVPLSAETIIEPGAGPARSSNRLGADGRPASRGCLARFRAGRDERTGPPTCGGVSAGEPERRV